jgi:hypothetical protein
VSNEATGVDNPAEELIQDFSKAVGDLILWANAVDHQLNLSLIAILALPDHPFIEPIVAQLDARAKAELLKKRARLIPPELEWRSKIVKWVREAERVQANRNVVAHHRVGFKDDRPVLHSSQLSKILSSLTSDLQASPARGLPEITSWIDHAVATYEAGEHVLTNLQAFAQRALRHQAIKADIEKKLAEEGYPTDDEP